MSPKEEEQLKKSSITSPIFYANSDAHIGHIYTGLICDAWTKFNLISKKDIIFTSGMDEHGQKVMQSAQKNNCNSQEYVDKINASFLKCFANYNIKFSNWIRTTDLKHEIAVKDFWIKLENNGYIYKNKYCGWYSISDEHYVEGEKDFFESTDKIVWQEEECYYFKLSVFEEKLLKYYEENKNAIFPNTRYNEAFGFLKGGLKDFSISRPKERLSWGIDVPNDDSQVIYVWIDALVSYLSSIGYPDVKYEQLWPSTHIIGKDILKFHAIYWPALLMAIELPLPKQLIVHGWWLNGDQKISKSLNNAIDIEYYTNIYGHDAVRFFLLTNMSLGEDASFKEEVFCQKIESVLSNKFGNLFSRLIGIAKLKKIDKVSYVPLDQELLNFIKRIEDFKALFLKDITCFDEYCNMFCELVDILNFYVDSNEVWTLDGQNLNDKLYALLYCLKVFCVFFYPLLPNATSKVLNYLDSNINFEEAIKHTNFKIKENFILFPRKK